MLGLMAEGLVYDLLQKGYGRLGTQHRGVGGHLQHPGHRAGVVGFRVVDYDIIDVRRVHHLADLLDVLVEEFGLYGFKQRRLFAAAQQIRIVGGAVIRAHDNVEHAQIGVQRTDPPHMFRRL